MSLAYLTRESLLLLQRERATATSGAVPTGISTTGDLQGRCSALAEQARQFGSLGPGPRWLAGAARSLAAVVLPWEQQVGPPAQDRSYRLLLRNESVEAWLIHWPSGGRLQLHDHGGASGALRVVSGVLRETYLDGGGQLATRDHGAGDAVAFGPSYIHDVANQSETGATSVHVYAPIADTMYFYRYDGPGQVRRLGEAPFEDADEVAVAAFGN